MLERISTHRGPSVLRTGASAIAAGLLLFASVFAEVLVSVERDGRITNLPLASLYIASFVAGTAALIVALNGLRLLPAHAHAARASSADSTGEVGLHETTDAALERGRRTPGHPNRPRGLRRRRRRDGSFRR